MVKKTLVLDLAQQMPCKKKKIKKKKKTGDASLVLIQESEMSP